MNPDLLINFTEGIRDASPNNRSVSTSGTVALVPGQFGDGGDFTSGKIITPSLDIDADFTLELWIAAGSSGILWDMSADTKCPVPCGSVRPVNPLSFIQVNLGPVQEII